MWGGIRQADVAGIRVVRFLSAWGEAEKGFMHQKLDFAGGNKPGKSRHFVWQWEKRKES